MTQQDTIAVIGAGVVGSAVSLALAREGRHVLLLDRSPPGIAGASFGNVGHVAAELVEPLPSVKLLFNFWRLLTKFDGPLDIPAGRTLGMLPWVARFARAAFQRTAHTRALAPLVLPSAGIWEHWLEEIGRPALLRRHGHYEVGFAPNTAMLQRTQSEAMTRLGINSQPVSAAQLQALRVSAGAAQVSGLWFPDSAHVVDPLEAVQAFAQAAIERGAQFKLLHVRSLALRGRHVDILSEGPPITVCAVVVCAGMGSNDLLTPLGLRAPLQPVRGYHIEIPGGTPFIDAPIVYTDQHVLVTPMEGRLRASTYMEFAAVDAPADSHKVDTLKRKVRSLGYAQEPKSDSWVGARPVLPDYLPGIGRAPHAPLYYAVGHQHIGLTLAPMTGDLMADLVAARAPRLPIGAFDLRRFGRTLATFAVFSLLAAATSARANQADAQLQAIYKTEWQWREQELPDTEDSQKPILAHLAKVDPASQERRLHHWQDVLAKMKHIRREALSPNEQINFDVYYPQIEALVSSQKFREFEMPANADTTFWTDIGYTARRTYRSVQDYGNWIAQMQDIPRYFHEQMDEMRAGVKRGFTPPKVTMTGRDGSLVAVTDVAAESSLFYAPFKEMPGVTAKQQAELRAQAVKVIAGTVQPAYRELLRFMREEYVPHTRTTLAAYDLPDGKAFYRAKIKEFVTEDRDPAEIHRFGEAEVARLHQQMLSVMKETGFSGDFPAFLQFLRSDPRFQAKTAEELLMRAAWIAKRFDAKAPQFFGMLPRMRFAIKPVPDDLAPFYTGGRGGPGTYLVNTYDLPSRPMYSLTALTLHESAPGHAFQMPLAMENKNQPEFRRHTYLSAYGEGWALYCEILGVEMGMYETPYDRFGMLNYQIWRAARLVVDTGIHSQGWSRDRAVNYMREYTALSEHEIQTEIDRYIAWPAQALSYYLGEDDILKQRARAEKMLGTRFNIRAFHDAVLELGSVPLPVLDARIDRFIAAGGVGPYPDME